MSDIEPILVEVAYALPEKQKIIELLVEPGTTALMAVRQSKITDFFPELDIENAKMGIFGQALGTKGLKPAKDHILQAGDRVEIYRPLTSDPKEVRRKRAEKAKEEKAS
ncbi:RnfH family protein [Teredinibacter sp. KSP-S5-2]|uniref:RnfH family protein n=1 Tax=Teredinibacter sp. KSP-S5-2 TaxID=3034506 RepID=UPI0029349B08|nr:RnfH family protein [Teredinibacter sp. KSP-S5-2]WNO08239.1 RnfH family protein [Teredinibacter sp. KSP-S5-2]